MHVHVPIVLADDSQYADYLKPWLYVGWLGAAVTSLRPRYRSIRKPCPPSNAKVELQLHRPFPSAASSEFVFAGALSTDRASRKHVFSVGEFFMKCQHV